MKFSLSILHMEVFSIEFALPSRGLFPVPDFYSSEEEVIFKPEDDN